MANLERSLFSIILEVEARGEHPADRHHRHQEYLLCFTLLYHEHLHSRLQNHGSRAVRTMVMTLACSSSPERLFPAACRWLAGCGNWP